jgi:hypothetical protein
MPRRALFAVTANLTAKGMDARRPRRTAMEGRVSLTRSDGRRRNVTEGLLATTDQINESILVPIRTRNRRAGALGAPTAMQVTRSAPPAGSRPGTLVLGVASCTRPG